MAELKNKSTELIDEDNLDEVDNDDEQYEKRDGYVQCLGVGFHALVFLSTIR